MALIKLFKKLPLNLENKKGFTLIELLIASSLFIVVVASTSAIFIRSLRNEKAIIALMAVNDNLSLAIETISREIRLGRNFSLNNEGTILTFETESSGQIIYSYDKDKKSITRNNENITGSNVAVDYFIFELIGESKEDGISPRVTIHIKVSPKDSRVNYLSTSIQTTISTREIDL